jgi:hypothetical protein
MRRVTNTRCLQFTATQAKGHIAFNKTEDSRKKKKITMKKVSKALESFAGTVAA